MLLKGPLPAPVQSRCAAVTVLCEWWMSPQQICLLPKDLDSPGSLLLFWKIAAAAGDMTCLTPTHFLSVTQKNSQRQSGR